MEEENAEHAVAIDAPEGGGLPLSEVDKAQDERQEQQEHTSSANEPLFLADGAEDKIGVLLRHELQLCLCAIEEALTLKSPRANGNLALVHVVAHATVVLNQSKEHFYAVALVVLQNVVKGVVGNVEKHERAQREKCYPPIVAQPGAESLPCQVGNEHDGDDGLHPSDVKGDDIHGEEQRYEGNAEGGADEDERLMPVATVDAGHGGCRQLDEQQYDEHANGSGGAEERRFGIADAHYEIDYQRETSEEYATCHTLAIEHQEKGEVDEGGARLVLHDDAEHGGEDEGQCTKKIVPRMDIVRITAHELGQGESCRKLGKFSGLQAQRPEYEPRMRAFDAVRVENGGKEQQEHEPEDDVGKCLIVAVVEKQEYQS